MLSRSDAAGLDVAAAAWERTVEHPRFAASDARFQLGVLNDAGGVFLRRYWARARQEDLNRALALWQQAVQRTPPDAPDLPSRLNNLGTGLRSRYARTGRLEDLEEGRTAYERACEAGVLVAPAHVIVIQATLVGNPLPAAERLTELRDALRAAWRAVPETAEVAQSRAELARLLDFPVDDLMHQGRFLITLAVQIYAAAGRPAQRLLELALQWPASLPYARAELESIDDLLPDGHIRTLYEHEAGRQPLLDALVGANLVHLSCHGQFQAGDPLQSGLLLADGQFTLREILAPGFTALDSARLAVLSACQTAIADFRNLPDESIGLPAGLTQAGVPSVVGTLWSVHDASTALLMVTTMKRDRN